MNFFLKKSPGRNPGRVLNPISYEKPDTIVSRSVPKQECSPGAGFSESSIFIQYHFWKKDRINGITLMDIRKNRCDKRCAVI